MWGWWVYDPGHKHKPVLTRDADKMGSTKRLQSNTEKWPSHVWPQGLHEECSWSNRCLYTAWRRGINHWQKFKCKGDFGGNQKQKTVSPPSEQAVTRTRQGHKHKSRGAGWRKHKEEQSNQSNPDTHFFGVKIYLSLSNILHHIWHSETELRVKHCRLQPIIEIDIYI